MEAIAALQLSQLQKTPEAGVRKYIPLYGVFCVFEPRRGDKNIAVGGVSAFGASETHGQTKPPVPLRRAA